MVLFLLYCEIEFAMSIRRRRRTIKSVKVLEDMMALCFPLGKEKPNVREVQAVFRPKRREEKATGKSSRKSSSFSLSP